MPESNVDILRQVYEAWWSEAGGDLGELLAVIDHDCVSRVHAPAPEPGTWHGPEGLIELMSEWAEGFDGYKMTAEEFIDAGDQVIARVFQEGRSRGSNVPVSGTFWFLYGMRDGKIASIDIYMDRSEAMQAVGFAQE